MPSQMCKSVLIASSRCVKVSQLLFSIRTIKIMPQKGQLQKLT